MATRTIESPGVEINELDLSQVATAPVGTNSYVMGFANQGPTYELINVSNLSEQERIYGVPTNASERYFYNTCKDILQANGNLLACRLPYGEGLGLGSDYSALLYPVFGVPSVSATSQTLLSQCSSYYFGQPIHVTLTQTQYNEWLAGQVGDNPSNWTTGSTTIADAATGISSAGDANKAGLIVLNSAKSSVNQYYEGYYIAFADNSRMDGVVYDYVQRAESLGPTTSAVNWINLTDATLDFALTGTQLNRGSISETIEFIPDYNFGDPEYNDSLIFALFKFSKSVYATDQKLSFILQETYTGSLDSNKTRIGFSGTAENAYLENIVNSKSQYVKVLVNPAISKITGSWDGKGKIVRLYSRPYTNSSSVSSAGVPSVGSYDLSAMNPYNLETAYVKPQANVAAGGTSSAYMDLSAGSYTLTVHFSATTMDVPVSAWAWDLGDGTTIDIGPSSTVTHAYTGYTESNSSLTVRLTGELDGSAGNYILSAFGLTILPYLTSYGPFTYGDIAVATGTYQTSDITTSKRIGCYVGSTGVATGAADQSLIKKVETALTLAENSEQIPIDVVCDAGLTTIWSATRNTNTCSVSSSVYYDSYDDSLSINAYALSALQDESTGSSCTLATDFKTMLNVLQQFVANTRKDCILLADPLRQVFIQGSNNLTLSDISKNFTQNILTPLKNLFGAANSNYVATYGNWAKVYDSNSDIYVWLPMSGNVANIITNVDRTRYPWIAPAGLNNGVVTNIVDLAINPNQKQRDLMYRNGLNPVVYFPGDGYVVWGQKTLQKKQSAFDRINVRRLFLTLEKSTLAAMRYFVFEPNTVFTRTRVLNTLKPLFEIAKNNDGVYDYLLVCDERNNTAEVIDNNELVVDIYLKPVRAAEFIRVNFVATRTDQNFEELVSG